MPRCSRQTTMLYIDLYILRQCAWLWQVRLDGSAALDKRQRKQRAGQCYAYVDQSDARTTKCGP